MPDIVTISLCFALLMNKTGLKVMCQLIEAMLCSSGRVRIVGLSRWTDRERSHVVLFSTDLTFTHAQLTDFYALRFQIEFNFRDAKPYFGLDNFMNVSPVAVSNAVGLAFLRCNLSAVLFAPQCTHQPDFSILDLNFLFRVRRYQSPVRFKVAASLAKVLDEFS